MTDYTEEVDVDITYTFTISESTTPDFRMTADIIDWLQTNMGNLTDDYLQPLFGKVNTGFDEGTVKTFGKKPVCDVYINNVEYGTDFDDHKPETVNSIVLCYLKGANNHTYEKACDLHDFIMQEMLTNEDFKRCDVVRETYVTNSEIRVQQLNRKLGVIIAFELSHKLY